MEGQKLHYKVMMCLLGDKRAFGPGVAELLDGVLATDRCRRCPGHEYVLFKGLDDHARRRIHLGISPHPPLRRR